MARFKNDPFPGTNYDQYQSWEKVTLPSGEVMYKVPNHPGYVFDPVASNATGRKVFRTNPEATIKEQQDAKDHQDKIQKQQEDAASPGGQATTLGLGVVGTVTSAVVINNLLKSESTSDKLLAQILADKIKANGGNAVTVQAADVAKANQAAAAAKGATAPPPGTTPSTESSTPSTQDGPQSSTTTTPPPTTTGAIPPGSDVGPHPVGSDVGPQQPTSTLAPGEAPPAGTTLNENGTITDTTGATVGRWAQGVGGAILIYQGVQDFNKDKVGGTLKVGAGAANVGAALGSNSASSVAAPAAVAVGAYDSYNALQHGGTGLRTGTTELGAGVGSYIAPGVGTVVGAAAGNVIGYGMKSDNPIIKTYMKFLPFMYGVKALMHKTTKQEEQTKWSRLADAAAQGANGEKAPKDAPVDPYVAAAYNANHGQDDDGVYKDGPRKGQKWTMEGAIEDAKANPQTFQLVYGNLKTYGKDWQSYSPEIQNAIIKENLDAGNYQSKKGDIEFVDEEKARAIKDKVLAANPGFKIPTPATATPAAPNTSTVAPPGQVAVQLPPAKLNGQSADRILAPGTTLQSSAPGVAKIAGVPVSTVPTVVAPPTQGFTIAPTVSPQAQAAAQGSQSVMMQMPAAPLAPPAPQWVIRNGQIIRKS